MSKKIDGNAADNLMDAVEHLAKLELEMRQLRWRFCYHDDNALSLSYVARTARAHCRQIMQALGSVEHRLRHGEADDHINAEQERAIRAVK